MNCSQKKPSVIVSLIPIVVLISLLIINVLIYKDDASYGPNQLALMVAAFVSAVIGMLHLKINYEKIEQQAIESISMSMQANLILLTVGSLIGLWILSGAVPTMIYYGIKLISPSVFLPVTCIICCIVSISTGSSWTTGGTVGIALIGIGQTIGIPVEMVAGAIISGAYFGDKMSPLSDTTNLAPAMTGTDLFTHIRHMLYTTVPSILIALVGFTILSLSRASQPINTSEIEAVLSTINGNFNITLWLLFLPAFVVFLVIKRIPALPALFMGALAGGLFALIFQQDLMIAKMGGEFSFKGAYDVIVSSAFSGFKSETGVKVIDSLFSRGGMSSMLNTVWLIIMAMVFGGVMEVTGMLSTLAEAILKVVTGTASLVTSTVASAIFLNITASDQYLAIVVTARMYREAYKKFGLHPKNLSRAVEDSATVTSVLVPWNSGGAYFASTLGVATVAYLPFCFFNLISPIMSITLATLDKSMERIIDEHEK